MSSSPPSNANSGCVGPSSEQAGKASACAGCPNQQACASGAGKQEDPAIAQIRDRLSSVRHKLLILSGKGGVGKSTVSSQLAWTLCWLGYSVGILDIDICGPSIPHMMGVADHEVQQSAAGWSPVYNEASIAVMSVAFLLPSKNDAVIWRGPRKTGLIQQFLKDVDWDELDFLIIDSPPGTSDEHISITTYLKDIIDGAIIVTTPQEIALLDVRKEINFGVKVSLPLLGVVENMSVYCCPNCGVHSSIFQGSTGGAANMCSSMNVRLLGTLPIDTALMQCCEQGKGFIETHGSDSETAKKWLNIVDNILDATPALRQTKQNHNKEQKGSMDTQ